MHACLAAGASVSAQFEGGTAALDQAARHGHAQVAAALLEAGAEVDARDHARRGSRCSC